MDRPDIRPAATFAQVNDCLRRIAEWADRTITEINESITALEEVPPGSGVTDHGALTGLTPDDDHPQYAKTDGTRGNFEAAGAVAAHVAAGDPHTGYQLESEKGAASGYASLNGSSVVPPAQLGTGSGGSSKFLREDSTFQTVAAGVSDGDKGDITVTASGATWTIDPDVVTFAKMQNASAESTLVGRGQGAGTGDFESIELGTGLSMTGKILSAAPDVSTYPYSPSASFTVATERYAIVSRHLTLSGGKRVTLQGTATLRIT